MNKRIRPTEAEKIVVAALLIIVLTALFLNWAFAGGSHHHINYQIPTNENQIGITNNYFYQGIALAAASGQHNYKATNQFQWSFAGAYSDLEDDSAFSFGLAKQLGKVLGTTSFSSDGESNIYTIQGSGTF